MKDWEEAYRGIGEIQTRVSDIVKNSLELFKKRNVKKVLDLCFGTGRHTIFFAENGFDVYGIDISKTGKEITEKKVKEKNLKNVHLEIADMHDMPFENDFFDAVIAVYSLEHNTLAGLRKTISELERVIKPDGILIATLISTKDPRHGTGKEIEPNTYADIKDPAETDVPHRFSDRNEVKELFAEFRLIDAKEKTGYSERREMRTVHWEIIAEKI
ncbi:class I SAM-dependent methyltransferase [Patescibacteria group bacterium]|nr:class I SAM-dependent methyltransferase [Patescibacteria group bacterium]MBU1922458.1 class I SAM-dependent methyltransferase [Patescibacteria group bacterium]